MKLLVRFIVYFVLGLALGASFYYGCARADDVRADIREYGPAAPRDRLLGP